MPDEREAPSTAIDQRQLAERVGELPALPQALLDVLDALQNDGSSVGDCARRIAHDPALAAKALRLANSSFYGVAGRVRTVDDALRVLGLRTLAALLTTAALTGSFAEPRCEGFDFTAFWRHALATALAAQGLATPMGLDENTAFTAGLLHDMGRLVFATHFPEPFAVAIAHARKADAPLCDAEETLLGISHAQVGTLLAERWRFAPAVVEAIRLHHAPPEGDEPTLADAVHLADAIAHALDLSGLEDDIVPALAAGCWQRAGVSPDEYLAVFAHTEAGLQGLCEALNL